LDSPCLAALAGDQYYDAALARAMDSCWKVYENPRRMVSYSPSGKAASEHD
jgi:hypothetical protein